MPLLNLKLKNLLIKLKIEMFKNGLLVHYQSDDIVLRSSEIVKLLDIIRKDVVWA